MRSGISRALTLIVAASLAVSPVVSLAQSLPELGDPSGSVLTLAQERKLGESVVRDIRMSGAYLEDPEVNAYLNELGNRLVTAIPGAPFEFEFFAVNDPTINAFALPGGYIGVNTGLILITQTESELAAVLAHEISHVTQHHIARSISNQKDAMLTTLAALAAAIVAARVGGSNGGQLAQAAIAGSQALGIQMQIDFTRQNEQEADRLGFQRLDAAGFDDNAMASFMERMQRATRFVEGNAPSYLRDHPVTYERIAEAQARAAGKPFRQVKDSLEFQMVRALLRSYEGTPREAIAFFEDALAQKRYNDPIAARYGLVASLLRAQDFKRAQAELALLEGTSPAAKMDVKDGHWSGTGLAPTPPVSNPMIDAMAGQVLMQSGQLSAAIARYQAALTKYPGSRQLIYDYPEALLKDKQAAKAAAFLDTQLQRYPNDGPLQQLAAKAYGALGKQMLSHQHQAEYYAWQGNLAAAVQQYQLALKANDGDFYTSSVTESRLRAVRQELDDQKKKVADGRG
jgi:predicted Zn-dependent protease